MEVSCLVGMPGSSNCPSVLITSTGTLQAVTVVAAPMQNYILRNFLVELLIPITKLELVHG